mgnify:FL=1
MVVSWNADADAVCILSGDWFGTEGAQGQQTVSYDFAGERTFVAICRNDFNFEPVVAQAKLKVVNPAGGGSGGGRDGSKTSGGSMNIGMLLLMTIGLLARTRRAALVKA